MGWEYKEADLLESVHTCIQGTIALGAEMDGMLIGLISIITMPTFYNRSLMQGQQLLWFVEKEYRHLGVGIELLKTAEDVCRNKGVKQLFMPAPSIGEKGFIKHYETNGYTKLETNYIKEL